jgi:hypothetical protein
MPQGLAGGVTKQQQKQLLSHNELLIVSTYDRIHGMLPPTPTRTVLGPYCQESRASITRPCRESGVLLLFILPQTVSHSYRVLAD